MSTDVSDAGEDGSPDDRSPADSRGVDPTTDERYASLHVEDAAMVVYDVSNHRAWVQSDLAMSLDAMA